MEFRNYYVCGKCDTWAKDGDKICGKCGNTTLIEYKACRGDIKNETHN